MAVPKSIGPPPSAMGSPPWKTAASGKGIPKGSRASQWTAEERDRVLAPYVLESLRRLDAIAHQRDQSLAQMALAWCLRRDEVTSVLTAASSVAQLEDSVAALQNLSFSDDQLGAIDRAVLA